MCKPIRPPIAAEHGGREVAVNDRRYGGCGGRRGARTAGCRPYGGKAPILSLRGPVRPVAIRTPRPPSPVPFSNVFKWQFENTTIFNSQLSIINSPKRAAMAVNTHEGHR